jgi:hypothetical protein
MPSDTPNETPGRQKPLIAKKIRINGVEVQINN